MAIDDPTPLPTADPDVLARFLSKVDRSGECWIWMAGRTRDGYGRFSIASGHRRGRCVAAHRVAWALFRGHIPSGATQVLHDCPNGDNPSCVNPAHLWTGTNAENRADMVAKGRQAKGDRSGPRLHPERMWRGAACWNSRFTDEQVREIRRAAGTQREIAALFGVSQCAVFGIRSGKTWKHVR